MTDRNNQTIQEQGGNVVSLGDWTETHNTPAAARYSGHIAIREAGIGGDDVLHDLLAEHDAQKARATLHVVQPGETPSDRLPQWPAEAPGLDALMARPIDPATAEDLRYEAAKEAAASPPRPHVVP